MDGALHDRHAYAFMRCVCTFAVLLGLSALAGAQLPTDPSRSEAILGVKAAEEAFRQAELKYDTTSAGTILADEFIGTGNHGEQVDKKQFLSIIGDKDAPLEVLEYGEMEIRVYGETAVVWSTIHEKAIYGRKVDEYRGRRTAIWVKRNMRWRCVTIHTSRFDQKSLQNK
jgi:hypothetical protein